MEAKKTVYVIEFKSSAHPGEKFGCHTLGFPPRRYASLELAQIQMDEMIKADIHYPKDFTYEYRIKAMTIKASSKVHVRSLNDISFTIIPK